MPFKNSAQSNLFTFIFLVVMVVGLFFFSRISWHWLLGGIFTSILFLISLTNTNLALAFLIFSMLLSPEIPLGGVRGRLVVLRLDDIFLVAVFFGWLAKMTIRKELGLLKKTELNPPILIYILFALISTFLGVLRRNVIFKEAVFYLLKYIEYFLIFFMVSNNIKNVKQIKIFAYLMLLVCFLVALNGWQQHAQGIDRVSAPFEGEGGEPNTLGGYLVFMMAIMLGLIIYSPNSYARFLILGLLFFCFPVLLWTLSRSSWIAFISMYLSFIILSKKAKPLLLIIFLLTLIILPQTLPLSVRNRIKETFIGQERILLGKKITFDESTTARLESWKVSLELWQNRPFFGYGVSSSVVTDHQYARVLKETGFFGFLSFVWILWTVFKFAFLTYQNAPTNFSKGLGLGFLCGYIGLLVHALGAATFIIIRIMEPFWFLTALVINLGQINKEIYDLKFAT